MLVIVNVGHVLQLHMWTACAKLMIIFMLHVYNDIILKHLVYTKIGDLLLLVIYTDSDSSINVCKPISQFCLSQFGNHYVPD